MCVLSYRVWRAGRRAATDTSVQKPVSLEGKMTDASCMNMQMRHPHCNTSSAAGKLHPSASLTIPQLCAHFRHLSSLLDYCWGSQRSLSFFQFVRLVIWIAILGYYSQKLVAVCAVVWMHTCNAWQLVGRFIYFLGRLALICCGIWTVCRVCVTAVGS